MSLKKDNIIMLSLVINNKVENIYRTYTNETCIWDRVGIQNVSQSN